MLANFALSIGLGGGGGNGGRSRGKSLTLRRKKKSSTPKKHEPVQIVQEPAQISQSYGDRFCAFSSALSSRHISMKKIRELTFSGVPDEPQLRSLCWKILLGYLPRDRTLWADELAKHRAVYHGFVRDLGSVDPLSADDEKNLQSPKAAILEAKSRAREQRRISKASSTPSDGGGLSSSVDLAADPLSALAAAGADAAPGGEKWESVDEMDDPLGSTTGNRWKQHFEDQFQRDEIKKDIYRTQSSLGFFRRAVNATSTSNEYRRMIAAKSAKYRSSASASSTQSSRKNSLESVSRSSNSRTHHAAAAGGKSPPATRSSTSKSAPVPREKRPLNTAGASLASIEGSRSNHNGRQLDGMVSSSFESSSSKNPLSSPTSETSLPDALVSPLDNDLLTSQGSSVFSDSPVVNDADADTESRGDSSETQAVARNVSENGQSLEPRGTTSEEHVEESLEGDEALDSEAHDSLTEEQIAAQLEEAIANGELFHPDDTPVDQQPAGETGVEAPPDDEATSAGEVAKLSPKPSSDDAEIQHDGGKPEDPLLSLVLEGAETVSQKDDNHSEKHAVPTAKTKKKKKSPKSAKKRKSKARTTVIIEPLDEDSPTAESFDDPLSARASSSSSPFEGGDESVTSTESEKESSRSESVATTATSGTGTGGRSKSLALKEKERARHARESIGDDEEAREDHGMIMARILFLFARLNPGIKYVQGMNELLAVLYYVNASDTEGDSSDYAEADTFFMFTALMAEVRDRFIQKLDGATTGIMAVIGTFNATFAACDPELYKNLGSKELDAYFYGFRWLSLLLSQEFELPDVLRLWDSFLSDEKRFQFVDYCCCAMLINLRSQLIAGGFGENLALLQSYPPVDIYEILETATDLRARFVNRDFAEEATRMPRHKRLEDLETNDLM